MLEDKLMLNDDKTEVLLIGTSKQLAKTSIESIKVGKVDVKLINTVFLIISFISWYKFWILLLA